MNNMCEKRDIFSRFYRKTINLCEHKMMHDHNLIDLIDVMQENRLVEFEDEIYVKNGQINPKFKSNVLSVVGDSLSGSAEISAGVTNIVTNVINTVQISSISGGSYYKDDNNNGEDDMYESIVGNLGA